MVLAHEKTGDFPLLLPGNILKSAKKRVQLSDFEFQFSISPDRNMSQEAAVRWPSMTGRNSTSCANKWDVAKLQPMVIFPGFISWLAACYIRLEACIILVTADEFDRLRNYSADIGLAAEQLHHV